MERALLLLTASDARRARRPWPRSAWDEEHVAYLTRGTAEAMGAERVNELCDPGLELDDVQIIALAQAEGREEDAKPFPVSF